MIEKKVLKKGQVVIPKDIRDLLGLHEGDNVKIDLEGDTIKIKKEKKVSSRLKDIAEKHDKEISLAEIKDQLKKRYEA
ncbi:MAG: AbrB/MazE/SpoVT family DNA-binding domain-containing protein [Candidatus Natronoplasma sp.]